MVRIAVLGVGLALLAGATTPALAATPTETLKQYTDQVLSVLDDPALKTPGRSVDRRAAVRKVAIEVFDVEETARRALGRHWTARTPAERAEFVPLFADLLERAYINRIDEYGGERVRFVGESVEADTATVRTKITTRQGSEVPVDARMVRKGDRWLMFDVIIENVSLIGNYRSQFDSIIRKESYAALVQRMKTKQEELSTAPKPRRQS